MNEIMRIEHQGKLILTSEQVAERFETDTNNIKKNYNENKEKFKEGIHYYKLEGQLLKDFKDQVTQSNLVDKHTSSLYLWTEKGTLNHMKILNTDAAWSGYDILVDTYFKAKEQKQITLSSYQIEDPIGRAERWIEEQKEKKLIEAERDEAKRTRAMISDKKTATAMGQIGGLTAMNNKLKKQLKLIEDYSTILAVQIQTGNTYPHGPLKAYCIKNNLTIEKVPDARYKEVNSYPAAAWKAVYNIDI